MSATLIDALLVRARAGDEAAINELFTLLRPFLKARAHAGFPDAVRARQDSSDVVQDTLGAAARGLPDFRGSTLEEFRAWLLTILQNEIRRSLERATAEKRDVGRERPLDGGPPPAIEATPSKIAAANELDEALRRALLALPEDKRQVLELRTLQGLPYDEVAQAMGRNVEAVKKLHQRAFIEWQRLAERPRTA